MFCSIVIPTIGRTSLKRTVQSVTNQTLDSGHYEIIIVNDSGELLPNEDWLIGSQVTIINTYKRERNFARNSGAAVARGEYLLFLDDDDWLLPEALKDFWLLAEKRRNALWLYGGIRIVDEQENILAEINSGLSGNCLAQIMGGAWAPIQASMIQAEAFFQVGGFNPFICGTEDEDLCRRIAFHGEFANTPASVACLFRGQSWSTSTNYQRAPEDTKYSRDLILSEPGAFNRLWSSADSPYWYGRILRVYLSTVSWNLRRRRFFTALSRIMFSLGWIIRSLRILHTRDYWNGLRAHHAYDTLHFAMMDYESRQQQR